MALENIRLFNYYTTAIMAFLYQEFPVKQHFSIEKFAQKPLQSDYSPERRFEIACHSLVWLKDNGFVDFHQGDTQNCAFSQVTLTMKGFTILSQETPKSVVERSTLGEDIKSVTEKGLESVASELLKTALLNSFKLFGA